MTLAKYMELHRFSDAKMAELVGGVTAAGVKKWRLGSRFPEKKFLTRIAEITDYCVMPNDMAGLSDIPVRSPQ